jgi:hypothetical protein
MAHMYEIGTRAWQPDTTEGWVASEVEEKFVNGDKVKLVFRLANGEVQTGLMTVLLHSALLTRPFCSGQDDRDEHCRA